MHIGGVAGERDLQTTTNRGTFVLASMIVTRNPGCFLTRRDGGGKGKAGGGSGNREELTKTARA